MNPVEPYYWNHPTVVVTEKLFPMFEPTLDGFGSTVKKLIVKKSPKIAAVVAFR